MKAEKYIEYNNELRNFLNKENKKLYEELLFKIRIYSFFKNEKEIEIISLEILQDLIEHQKNGKNFVDVYGKNINKLAKDIVNNISKESSSKITQSFFSIILFFIISNLTMTIFSEDKLNIFKYTSGNLISIGIIILAIFYLINYSYKFSSIVNWFISTILFTSVIISGNIFYKSVKLDFLENEIFIINTNLKNSIIIFLVAAIIIILVGYYYKNTLLFSTIIIPPTLILIVKLMIVQNIISDSYNTIATLSANIIGIFLMILCANLILKRKQ